MHLTLKEKTARDGRLAGVLAALMMSVAVPTGLAAAQEGEAPPPPAAKAKEEAPKAAADEKKADEKEDEKKEKTIADITDGHTVMPGLFTLYQDPKDGTLRLQLSADQLDTDFIYFTHTVDGVTEAGHFRGAFRGNTIFQVRRHFDRLEFVEQNVHFYFDPDNPLSRASDANISPAVLASVKIEAEDTETGALLIKADSLFKTEALHQVSPTPNPRAKPGESFKLGSLAKDRTRIAEAKSFDDNLAVTVDYVYANPKPLVPGSEAVTDARAVTLTMRHNLIAMPPADNGYVPRFDDARVGYFFTRVTDLTDHSATPYRDLIDRWNLVKKDSEAALSEPIEPITWWIENTTPVEYRAAITEGALAWNKAFESAGFKNALVVKVQPDDADWDADDINYNVLRWTSSPNPPFGGYGPNFVNPRTGQIIGADIMLENIYVTSRLVVDDLFDLAGRGLPQGGGLSEPHRHFDADGGSILCSAGHFMQQDLLMGRILAASGYAGMDEKRIVQESLKRLTLHEIGHTLGLNHNMRASQLHGLDTVYDKEVTQGVVTGSVMDYPAINIPPKDRDSANFYDTLPGPYDHWAIQFGYDPAVEADARTALLARSTEPALAFGNDADDMRAPGRHNDPRVMIGDLSSDAIGYAADRTRLVRKVMGEVLERYTKEGESWHALRNAYLILTGQHNVAMRVASRYVGGIYQDRAVAGQAAGQAQPFMPVALDDQKRAMALLAEELFAPDAFAASEALLAHLMRQRRGFDHFGRNEDPELHGRYLAIQKDILDHLIHPNTLRRLTDSRLYGNDYAVADMMQDLTAAIFAADRRGDVNTVRQMLQIEYTARLAAGVGKGSPLDAVARSAALASLTQIDDWMQSARGGNAETRAHRAHIRLLIEKALYPGA